MQPVLAAAGGQYRAQLPADAVRIEATLEGAGLVLSERRGRDKLLWFNAAPIQWIHERWSTEFSAYWAARLTRLKYSAEGADVRALPVKTKPGARRRG